MHGMLPRMPTPPSIAALPPDKLNTLLTVVKPRFDAYFSITSNLTRAVWDPQGFYTYPNEPMLADMVYLWAVFADVYEIVGKAQELAAIVRGDAYLKPQIRRIIEGSSEDPDGSFWHSPSGANSLQQVPLDQAVDTELKDVFRTLRNGFAHSNWLYENLSALQYWNKRGWRTASAPPAFRLQSRPAKNYITYIADAKNWDREPDFWRRDDLRILVTPSPVLRYHLHLFLNYVLSGGRRHLFGNECP